MSQQDITLIEGNTPDVEFVCSRKKTDSTVGPEDLSGQTVELYFKQSKNSSDEDPTTVKLTTDDSSIEVTDAANGKCLAHFPVLDLTRKFYHLDIVNGAGKRLTFGYGRVNVTNV